MQNTCVHQCPSYGSNSQHQCCRLNKTRDNYAKNNTPWDLLLKLNCIILLKVFIEFNFSHCRVHGMFVCVCLKLCLFATGCPFSAFCQIFGWVDTSLVLTGRFLWQGCLINNNLPPQSFSVLSLSSSLPINTH